MMKYIAQSKRAHTDGYPSVDRLKWLQHFELGQTHLWKISTAPHGNLNVRNVSFPQFAGQPKKILAAIEIATGDQNFAWVGPRDFIEVSKEVVPCLDGNEALPEQQNCQHSPASSGPPAMHVP